MLNLRRLLLVLDFFASSARAADTPDTTLITNGPAVFTATTIHLPPPAATHTNSDGKIIRRPIPKRTQTTYTNYTFQRFIEGSLNHLVWTNLLALTNGRTSAIWSVREHPPGWPQKPPIAKWDTNGLMWGMRGLTALSPCWEAEGAPGQVPITALTRRHGYARGHSLGNEGFTNDYRHAKVWFLLPNNKIFQTTIVRGVDRMRGGPTQQDYSILLFKDDLPPAIQPLRVVAFTHMLSRYTNIARAPWPLLMTEQTGHVNAGLPGFFVDIVKGGDSGSPNLLPMPGELVFCGGRTTSPPSAQMQRDIDELCRLEHLDPKRYQLEWIDLSNYPSF